MLSCLSCRKRERYHNWHEPPSGGIRQIPGPRESLMHVPGLDVVFAPAKPYVEPGSGHGHDMEPKLAAEWEHYNYARYYSQADWHNQDHNDLWKAEAFATKPDYKNKRGEMNPTYTWNVDILGYPAAIATVYKIEHIQACVNYVKAYCPTHELVVNSGRHSRAAMRDNAFIVDMSGMKHCEVQKGFKAGDGRSYDVVSVQGGATLNSIDIACAKGNVCTTLGSCPSTGVGLLLLGGIGHLNNRCGLGVQNLIEATVVVADGSVRK